MTLERLIVTIPNSVTYSAPFLENIYDHLPRMSWLLEQLLFFGDSICLGRFDETVWTQEGLEEAAAFQATGPEGKPATRAPEQLVNRFYDIRALLNELCSDGRQSQNDFEVHSAKKNDDHVDVFVSFGKPDITEVLENRVMPCARWESAGELASKDLLLCVRTLAKDLKRSRVLDLQDCWREAPAYDIALKSVDVHLNRVTIKYRVIDRNNGNQDITSGVSDYDRYNIRQAISYFVKDAVLDSYSYANIGSPANVSGQQRLRLKMRADKASLGEILKFQDHVFDGSPSIAHGLMYGQITPAEFEKVYLASDKWRRWVSRIGDDEKLLASYVREISKEHRLSKLPSKTVRFLTVAGLGAGLGAMGAGPIGAAAGLAIGAADSLFLDRCISGWKPSEFIENHMRPMIED